MLSVVCSYLCNPDDAGRKTDGADGTCEQSRSDHLISGILYADECAAVFRISDKYSQSAEEAACVDGASTWTTYWKIIFPIMKPMHATVAVLTALGTWNDVMTPLVIMSGTGKNTLPLAQLNSRHSLERTITWHLPLTCWHFCRS